MNEVTVGQASSGWFSDACIERVNEICRLPKVEGGHAGTDTMIMQNFVRQLEAGVDSSFFKRICLREVEHLPRKQVFRFFYVRLNTGIE